MAKSSGQIKSDFMAVYKGYNNIMTPDIVRYGEKVGLMYELSSGDFMGTPLYGVTVINHKGGKMHDMNESFNVLADAETYINNGFDKQAA